MDSNQNHFLTVTNFQDFVSARYRGQANAVRWKRELKGDYSEIVKGIKLNTNMAIIEPNEMLELELSQQGEIARDTILSDFNLLKDLGASPTLNLIEYYERDDVFPYFPTDVYSYHVDRSPIPTDTILCTYHGAASDILPNSQAKQKIHVPAIRKELQKLYDGNEADFDAFLKEYFFDLHYQEKPNAQPINLGLGNLWKLSVDHPESNVLPCVHRAPKETKGELRLLLIC